ncbi:MAG: prephenate dehydrogenase/arogenate dehydrogenase family protein [Nitrospinota bacterium]|nr:prephenate dehydrogenase/arogenate dehydrogenase family protein [Nitrospinota bacterium]
MKIFKKMTVIGVGLLGASLAKACRKYNLVEKISGHGRNVANLEKAKSMGVVDDYNVNLADAVKDSDLVVLCTPVSKIVPLIETMLPHLKVGVVITDVGSVKGSLVHEADKLMREGIFFVGSHPIAGGEKSGLEASREDLYFDAKCILTPTSKTHTQALEKVGALWESVGMDTLMLDADEHDFVFGAVSHLPHLVAYALMNTLGTLRTNQDHEVTAYSGAGLKDITRIASGDPVMWRDICLSNKKHSLDLIDRFQKTLSQLSSSIEKNDGQALEEAFYAANKYRMKVI